MEWTYPAEDENPWFDRFIAFVQAMDASGYAAREDRSIIFAEGGIISWDSSTGLTWSDEIWITAPITGFSWRVQPQVSPLAIAEGEVLYVSLNRGPLTNTALTASVGVTLPSDDSAIAIAVRVGTKIYWRNGLALSDGRTFPSGLDVQSNSISEVSFSLVHNGLRTTNDPVEAAVGGGLFNGGMSAPTSIRFALTAYYNATGSTGDAIVRLYDVGTPSTPASPVLRSTLTIPFASSGGTIAITNDLTAVSSSPGTDEILDVERVYEVTAEIDGSNGATDVFNVWKASLEVS
jgi:hypothetical protein